MLLRLTSLDNVTIQKNGSGVLAVKDSGINLTTKVTGTLPVANGGTGVTISTGTGSTVLNTSPTLVTALGTPASGVLTNCTGTAAGLTAGTVTTNANLTGAVTSVGNATSLGSFTSAQLSGALTNETGTGSAVFNTSPTLVTPALGTPSSGTLTNCTFPTLNQNTTGTASNVTGTVLIANGGTSASNAPDARTNLGILGSNLNSNLASSVGITQAGALGGDVIFNSLNAPTVTITAGTWLLIGSVAARTSDTADTLWAQFWNSTDSAAFGGGAAQYTNLTRGDLGCTGVVTVAGSKVIYFKVFRSGSSTLDVGSSSPSGPSGFIQAIRLTT